MSIDLSTSAWTTGLFHSCRLHIQSRSLDVVYNPAAVKWLTDFFTRPHQTPDAQLRRAARERYESMKQKTKQEFISNWEQILEGKLVSDVIPWVRDGMH